MQRRSRARQIQKVLAIVVAVVGTSCVSSGNATSSSDSALPFGSAGNPADASMTIEVHTLDTMQFDPEEIEVARGETVLFVVSNAGKIPHEFTIGDEAEQERHAEEMADMGTMPHDHPFSVWLEAGETKELAWEFGEAGELLYGCHVPGHYEAGMVGTITVE